MDTPPPSPAIEAVRHVDGYRGIWFELGIRNKYGDRYSGGLGTYTACHEPAAIYCPEVGKTFFTYGGTTAADQRHLLIMASAYDHKTGLVPKPVVVMDKEGVNDPHDNGSIQVDGQGYLWIFVSGRNWVRPGYIYRSLKPWSVEGFERIDKQEVTYPEAWYLPGQGFFLLFTKYTGGLKGPARELWWKTSPDGRIWSADHKLAGFGGHYQVSGQQGKKVATFFNWHPDSENNDRTNLYYAETSDQGKTWTTADGTPLQLPLGAPKNPALVIDYHAQGKRVYTCDLNFDHQGQPVLLYIRSKSGNPGPEGDPREWTVSHWTGERWETNVITTSSHNYDMGSLYIEQNEWRVVGPSEPGPQKIGTGGEIALWVSRDQGKTWVKRRQITSGSKFNHSFVRRPVNATDPFYAFWADGHADHMSESRLYFCDSTGEQVKQLPYTMENVEAQPAPLDAAPVPKR